MKKVEIYSHRNCSYCVRAKQLLQARGITYEEQDVGQTPQLLTEMVTRTGGRTFPQIIINDEPIGGYTELLALDSSQQLDNLINPSS